MSSQDHVPKGKPGKHLQGKCRKCGKRWICHRVEHIAKGEPCTQCHLPRHKHRPRNKHHSGPRQKPYFVGVDGEGIGRGPHKYVMLCASDSSGKKEWELVDARGLSTEECLDFLLALPAAAKSFAFSFHYDITKILKDLPNDKLYALMRPELRPRPPLSPARSPRPIRWKKYVLNYQGTKLSIRCSKRSRIIWDVFRFYGAKFVNALEDWKVLSKIELAHMASMKEQRSTFRKQDLADISRYCLSECRALATLVEKLAVAHGNAGLELRSFYGAGSTGGATLNAMRIKDKIRPVPDKMVHAVACAFFGGRFEHSVIGSIAGPVWSYDISSAYPYQTAFLPCLVHARWRWTRRREDVNRARAALVKYGYRTPCEGPWAPFPFRLKDGTIVYARTSGGGWLWQDEYQEGEAMFPRSIEFRGAWLLHSDCRCQPFRMIPRYYLNRLRLGKEGAGIVLKLGMNSVYGKLAQSVGEAPFRCQAWAGMVTSGTRAQLLRMMRLHRDLENVLAVATDGIYSRERIDPPKPRATGTNNATGADGKEEVCKPLGGWERKVVDKGVFFTRPGIYFPLRPTEAELSAIRARGIGRAALSRAWKQMIAGYEKGLSAIDINLDPPLEKFVGCKTGISVGLKSGRFKRSPDFGEWIPRKVGVDLTPMPKRRADVETRDGYSVLRTRSLPKGIESAPYNRSVVSKEALTLIAAQIEESEQEDGDFVASDE